MFADREAGPQVNRPRQVIDLTESECWELLRTTSVGRVVFTHHAMPAIRPVNHMVDGTSIIFRTHLGTAIASRASAVDLAGGNNGAVVCYEADDLDPGRHTGWSVIVTGLARLVKDPVAVAHYTKRLHPWIAGTMDNVVSIEPRFVSGVRLVGWCA